MNDCKILLHFSKIWKKLNWKFATFAPFALFITIWMKENENPRLWFLGKTFLYWHEDEIMKKLYEKVLKRKNCGKSMFDLCYAGENVFVDKNSGVKCHFHLKKKEFFDGHKDETMKIFLLIFLKISAILCQFFNAPKMGE